MSGMMNDQSPWTVRADDSPFTFYPYRAINSIDATIRSRRVSWLGKAAVRLSGPADSTCIARSNKAIS